MRFRYGFANAVSEDEAKELYETFAVPASGGPIFQAASANLNPWTEAKVNSKYPDRGPLLIISGENDHTVPWAIANASFKKQKRNEAVTEIVEIPNRGPRTHSRQRLARGRGNGTGLRPAVAPTDAPVRKLEAGASGNAASNGSATAEPEPAAMRDGKA